MIYVKEKMLIDIYILEILVARSAASSRLKQNDIIHILEQDYGITISRNTLSNYIKALREYGYIAGERGVYLLRRFSNIDIKILIDSLMYSKTIPSSDIHRISTELKKMSEPSFQQNLNNFYYMNTLEHTDNSNVHRIIETIHTAIERQKKVKIKMCRHTISGELESTTTRIVDPYYIVSEKARYYLLCYSGRDDIEPRRIDRIQDAEILDTARTELTEIPRYKYCPFDISNYMKEHIYMYSGENARITLKLKKDNFSDFIDWYGKNYRIIENNEDSSYAVIQIKANSNAVYFWALQYGSIAEVLAPESLRKQIRDGVEELLEKYKKDLP